MVSEVGDSNTPYTAERLEVLKVAVSELVKAVDGVAVYTAITDKREPRLMFEVRLNDPTATRFAALIFNTSQEALIVNTGTVILHGLMYDLPASVCKLCHSLRDAPPATNPKEER